MVIHMKMNRNITEQWQYIQLNGILADFRSGSMLFSVISLPVAAMCTSHNKLIIFGTNIPLLCLSPVALSLPPVISHRISLDPFVSRSFAVSHFSTLSHSFEIVSVNRRFVLPKRMPMPIHKYMCGCSTIIIAVFKQRTKRISAG